MDDLAVLNPPPALDAILAATKSLGFSMASEPKTGALLRLLASSKRGGRFLEIGTGTGVGTAWILSGMDSESTLDTVDNNVEALGVAQRLLAHDARVDFHVADGAEYLAGCESARYDTVYADAWPGKFSHLDEALALLRPGGIYFVDDLLPQPNWPADHAEKVARLMANLENREGFSSVKLAWASGLMMLVRCGPLTTSR